MKNFPGKRKALIVGILKAGFTFGSMAVAAIYHVWFTGYLTKFMITMAAFTGGVQLLGTLGLRVVPTTVTKETPNPSAEASRNATRDRERTMTSHDRRKDQPAMEQTRLLGNININHDENNDNSSSNERPLYEESDDDLEGEDNVLKTIYHKHPPPAVVIEPTNETGISLDPLFSLSVDTTEF